MNNQKILPVILCGGSGSRLWPLSRSSFPKQFIQLLSKSNKSLLQETILRISKLENIDQPIIICNEEHRFIVAEQMRKINITPKSIILEPVAKNTAPAITLAALKAFETSSDQILLVLSSDHLIKDKEKFVETINQAFKVANQEKLVLFGIKPTLPETGYGYIKSGESLFIDNTHSFKIKKFVEKPNLSTAKKLISEGNYTWNSGIFVFKTGTILRELNKFESDLVGNCENALKRGYKDLEFQRLDKKYFEKCRNISIDKAIMEKTDLGTVIFFDGQWSDLGSWQSLWENEEKDNNGNVLSGKIFTSKVRNSFIKSNSRLVVCNKVNNLIVVETNDAILITDKEESQNIKNLVNQLDKEGFPEALKHRRVFRPWGNYYTIAEDFSWQVKRIEVNPGSQLSLQMHNHRAEHWVVVKGIAKVTIDDKLLFLKENESTFIPLGSKHRLSNPGDIPLILIEVQSGSYLGEDDIVRFKDDYGRN